MPNASEYPRNGVCPACSMTQFIWTSGAYCHFCMCPLTATPEEAREFTDQRIKDERKRTEEERKAGVARALERWETQHAPRRYRAASMDQLPAETAEAIRKALASGRWPYLLGPLGAGKSFAAAAIARDCIEQGRQVHLWCVADLLGRIRGAMDTTGSGPEAIVREETEVEVLILDDLAVQRDTDWVHEILFRIINGRYSEERTTVFSSNVRPHDLINERIRSRLVEVATVIPLLAVRPERSKGKA